VNIAADGFNYNLPQEPIKCEYLIKTRTIQSLIVL